jgi:HEAT repeat protein
MKRGIVAALALALPAIGAPSIPTLAEQLNSTERDARRDATYQLRGMGAAAKPLLPQLIAALDDPDSQVFANAIGAIAELGPEAKEAIPKLIELTDSRRGRGFRSRDRDQALLRASFALSKIGAAAKPDLLAALRSEDAGIRRGAAKAMGMMGAAAGDAVPALIENLGHGDSALRLDAAEALGLIGPAAVNPLIDALSSADSKVREGSAISLGELGTIANPASDRLLSVAKSENDVNALAAAIRAIPRVGTAHEKAVPVLIKALCDQREEVHRAGENALIRVRPPEKLAVPELVKLLAGEHAALAGAMLGHFGADARIAAPALLAAAKRTSPPDEAFLAPLAKLGAAAVPALVAEIATLGLPDVKAGHWTLKTLSDIGGACVPPLEKELLSNSATVRYAAVKILAVQGSSARSVHSGILRLAGDPEPQVRAAVLEAVGPLGVAPGRVVELVSALVKDREASVRAAAAVATGALGSSGKTLADEMAQLIGDRDSTVRVAAMKSIGAIGGGKEAAAMLATHLPDASLRPAVVEALTKLGNASAVAMPQLLALFPASDTTLQAQLLKAFTSIGADAKTALPAVEPLLKSGDETLRAAAVSAYVAIQPDKAISVAAMTTAINDASRVVREAAAKAIIRLAEQNSERAAPATLSLIELIRKESEDRYAMEALRALRVKDPAAISLAFGLENEEIRMWAAERVARMGRDGRQFLPELEKLRASSSDGLRSAARRAMDALNR